MRESFQAELDRLADDLARMARLAARMMTNASDALHQADLALAELVITGDDEMDVLHDDVDLVQSVRGVRHHPGGQPRHAGQVSGEPVELGLEGLTHGS